MKKESIYSLGFLLLLLALFTSCKSDENFDNRVFISSSTLESIFNRPASTSEQFTIRIAMANVESAPVRIDLAVDPAKLEAYSAIHNEEVELLAPGFYSFSTNRAEINQCAVESTPVLLDFDRINTLDREKIYVLPVSIVQSNIAVLESQRTVYYVIRAGALINVVADMENNSLHINQWNTPDPVNNLTEFTLEALIRVRNFDRLISTVMGIEGRFLIRIGDANFPPNQIQIATSVGNLPRADATTKGLPTNEWVHIAVTFNGQDRRIRVYVNGRLQSEENTNLTFMSFGLNGANGFYIGRSWEDARFLAGEISECRIWNLERTVEEIANNPYSVDPASQGLVAYWKIDEGSGNIVRDHTENANDLVSRNPLRWNQVSIQ